MTAIEVQQPALEKCLCDHSDANKYGDHDEIELLRFVPADRPSTLTDEAVKEITKQIVEGADGEVISLPYSTVRDALENVFEVRRPDLTDEERKLLAGIVDRHYLSTLRIFTNREIDLLRTLVGKEQG